MSQYGVAREMDAPVLYKGSMEGCNPPLSIVNPYSVQKSKHVCIIPDILYLNANPPSRNPSLSFAALDRSYAMQTEPKSTNRVQYHCAFLDYAASIAPITSDWTNWKPSAIFDRSYRYRINSGEYEYIDANVSMIGNIGAIVEREDRGHSTAGHASVCHMHGELYTLVRVSELGFGIYGSEAVDRLDRDVRDIFDVPSIVPLSDRSLEIVVLKSYLLDLTDRLNRAFTCASVDSNYDPCEPSNEAVSQFGYDLAKSQAIRLFLKRVEGYNTGEFWPIAASYYYHLRNKIQLG